MGKARRLSLILVLLAFAPRAHAGTGLYLRWNACYGDGGTPNKVFACNTNAGSQTLVGGFELGADMPLVSGNDIILDVASVSPTLPAWWQMRNLGTCRQAALSMNFVSSPSAVACVDWGQGGTVGGIGAYNIGKLGPNTARIVASSAAPAGPLSGLLAGQEYYSFTLVISNVNTVGAGACAGCFTPACLLLRSINVTTPVTTDNVKIVGPANGVDSDFVMWQGGGGFPCFPTPTVRRTWGEVKALYH